jgi:hypothetical protein
MEKMLRLQQQAPPTTADPFTMIVLWVRFPPFSLRWHLIP